MLFDLYSGRGYFKSILPVAEYEIGQVCCSLLRFANPLRAFKSWSKMSPFAMKHIKSYQFHSTFKLAHSFRYALWHFSVQAGLVFRSSHLLVSLEFSIRFLTAI